MTLDQVISTTGNALWFSPLGRLEANTPGTGGFFDGPQQRLGIFHKSPITTQADLAKVAIEDTESATGPALTLGDVANVVEDHQPLIGDAVLSKGPGLMLVVEKLPEANVMEVTKGVDEALRAMGPGLAGIQVDSSLFRPANYIAKSTHNVAKALLIGLALLVLLLLALLFEWRTALIAAVTTLLSLALAVIVLHLGGATINAMVMAGLVLAVVVVVGDSIVDTENIRRRLRLNAEAGDGSAETTVLEASMEVRSPLAFGTLIVLLALVPIFVLKGETGAFAPPIALAYAAAVLASMVVALAITPALSLLLLAKAPLAGRESPLVRSVRRGHDRFLPKFVGSPRVAIGAVGVVALVGVAVLPLLERTHSLIPTFKDRDLLVHWEGAPGSVVARDGPDHRPRQPRAAVAARGPRRRCPRGAGGAGRPGGQRQLGRALGEHRSLGRLQQDRELDPAGRQRLSRARALGAHLSQGADPTGARTDGSTTSRCASSAPTWPSCAARRTSCGARSRRSTACPTPPSSATPWSRRSR